MQQLTVEKYNGINTTTN